MSRFQFAMVVLALSMTTCIVIEAGERLLTVEGEILDVTQGGIQDRTLTISGEGQTPRQFNLSDVVEFGKFADRELGELKTRYVRIEHPASAKTSLSLAEVMIFEGDRNIASEGNATQSAVEREGVPGRAIDGNTNGEFDSGHSSTLTPVSDGPWWEIDLKRDVTVQRVEIFNRTDDGEAKRLNGARLVLLDAQRRPLWVDTIKTTSSHHKVYKVPRLGSEFKQFDLREFERYAGFSGPARLTASSDTPEFLFIHGGSCVGRLDSWTTESLSIQLDGLTQPNSLHVPRSHIREIWLMDVATDLYEPKQAAEAKPKETKPEQGKTEHGTGEHAKVKNAKVAVPRANEDVALDHVYARNDKQEIKRISGTVLGREGDTLQIQIDGQNRKIGWAKIVGIVLRPTPNSLVKETFELVQLSGGQLIPCHCRLLSSEQQELETLWGEKLVLPRNDFVRMTIQNGRLRSLMSLTPTRVDQIGYFDLIRPYQRNHSLTGDPLQVGDQTFEEGLCIHSRSAIDFELSGQYQQFRCQVGLQSGTGDRGHAIVKVRVNGEIRWEESVRGKEAARLVNVDLTGGQTLGIEVDFGNGFDVADHVVWGNPQLLRQATPVP